MVTVYFFPFLCCRVWLPRWPFYFTGQFSLFQKELFSLNLLLQRNVTCLGAANKAIFPIKFFPFLLISQNAFSVEPISKDLEKSVRFWVFAKVWTIYVPNFKTSIYKKKCFSVLKIEERSGQGYIMIVPLAIFSRNIRNWYKLISSIPQKQQLSIYTTFPFTLPTSISTAISLNFVIKLFLPHILPPSNQCMY